LILKSNYSAEGEVKEQKEEEKTKKITPKECVRFVLTLKGPN